MDPVIAQWMAVIDKVTHYELLGVQPGSGADVLHRAYQGFASTFHPDVHLHRTPEERASVNTIFKRGTEAYRVLSDPALRARYEEKRTGKSMVPAASTRAPLPPGSIAPTSTATSGGATKGATPKPGASSNIAGRLEDFVKQPRARPFAQQAEALAKKGEHAKAKLQLKLAMNFDAGNEALAAYLKELDALIEQDKKKPYQPK
jgi:curved DNA-binding protein CbpA